MPHQCTACGHTFEDGSKEMLSGCPDCGGNKFQFRPAGDDDDALDPDETTPPSDAPDDPTPPSDSGTVAETVGRATTRVRDFVSSDPAPQSDPNPDAEWPDEWQGSPSGSGGDGDIIDADARRNARPDDEDSGEDTAQASARTEMVSESELDASADDAASSESGSAFPSAEPPESEADPGSRRAPEPSSDGEIVGEPTGEDPDLTELREQLNDQFESIKILEPGQYELNLMELYDREEYIIALQENGRYVIQVPEQWIGDDPDDR